MSRNPLKSLLPADIVSVFSPELPVEASLLGVETELARKMAEKRYNEFTHGRHCARLALRQLGFQDGPIGKGESREPLWPANITGTISHTSHFAAAAVAPIASYQGIGLDMESDTPLEEKLFKAICMAEEIDLFDDRPGETAKLLFSAKESIYKCLWPTVQRFIDFTEMQVILDTDQQSFSAIPHTDKCGKELVDRLQGRYDYYDGLVISTAWIAAE